MICTHSTGGQQEAKSHNLSDPTGVSQVHSPVIMQLAHQLYQTHRVQKILTLTPRMGESHITRGLVRLNQPDNSYLNLDEFLYIPSVKCMNPVEASSSALRLLTEVGINQVGESGKVSNSRSWKYLTEFMLDVIKDPEEE